MNKKYPTLFLTWFNKFLQVPYPGKSRDHKIVRAKKKVSKGHPQHISKII